MLLTERYVVQKLCIHANNSLNHLNSDLTSCLQGPPIPGNSVMSDDVREDRDMSKYSVEQMATWHKRGDHRGLLAFISIDTGCKMI
jgi:hypothetical protein